jgi:hypothetical protein
MTKTNYLSPLLELKLTSPSGKVLDVTDPPPSTSRTKLGAFVQSINVKLTMGMTSEIGVTLEATRESFERVLNEQLEYFLPGGFMTVRMGYARGPYTQEFTGVLQQPNASFNSESITLNLTAKGGLWYSSRNETTRTFNNDTVLDCLRLICADYASEVYYLSPEHGEIPLTRPIADRLAISQKIDLIVPVFETFRGRDWFTMKTLIQERAKMRFYVSGQRIVLFSMSEQAVVSKAPQFVFMEPFDIGAGIYPMLSFSPQNSEYPITVGLRELIARDYDPDSKTLFEVIKNRASADVDAPQTKRGGLPETGRQFSGAGVFNEIAGALGVQRNIVQASARDPDPDGRVVRSKNIGEEQGGIIASWQTIGDPAITPGRLVTVAGVTRLFSGNYFVREVDYTGDLSGFMMNVTGFTMGYSTNPYEFYQAQSAAADRDIPAGEVATGGIGRTPT